MGSSATGLDSSSILYCTMRGDDRAQTGNSDFQCPVSSWGKGPVGLLHREARRRATHEK